MIFRRHPLAHALALFAAAGGAGFFQASPANAQTFVNNYALIDTPTVIPSFFIPLNNTLQVFPFPDGKLDTGTFGSIRSGNVEGTLINDADLRVGFSSESSGLQSSASSLILNRVVFGLPARLQAAQGTLNGTLRNEGATFITGSYTASSDLPGTPTIPAGTTFAAPAFGGFSVSGLVENLTSQSNPLFPPDVGTWTNHGNLDILGRVRNTGVFESVNAPLALAFPAPLLSYEQTIVLGTSFQSQGARFDNESGGVAELRQGTTFVNNAEFSNYAGATVRVLQDAILETAGQYSSSASILAGQYIQEAGANTEVDGGVLRTRDRGAILNQGAIVLSGNGLLDNGNYVLNGASGTILVMSGSRITQGSGGLLGGRFENEGHLTVAGTMTGGSLTTTGRLIVAAGGAVETDELAIEGGHVTIQGRVGFDPSGPAGPLIPVSMSGGLLDGSGFINGDLFLSGSGPAFSSGPCSAAPNGIACFTPGNSPGSMTIAGMLAMGAGSILELEITRDAQGLLAFDTVSAHGMRFEAGSLIRVLLDPSVGTLSGPLQLLTCTGLESECSFLGEVLVEGGTAGLEFLESGFSVVDVTAVPEPSQFALLLAGFCAVGLWFRGRRSAPRAARPA